MSRRRRTRRRKRRRRRRKKKKNNNNNKKKKKKKNNNKKSSFFSRSLSSAQRRMAFSLSIASCGLKLDEAVRVAVGLRPGLDLCVPHECHCGFRVDVRGVHSFACERAGRTSRHHHHHHHRHLILTHIKRNSSTRTDYSLH